MNIGKFDHGGVIAMLVEVARCAYLAVELADDREDGGCIIDAKSNADLSSALAALDGLPKLDDEYVRDGWSRAKAMLSATPIADASKPGQAETAGLVPGVMNCAKCGLRLVRTNLHIRNGTTTAGDSKTEPCPNGCGPLWPITWEQEARDGWRRLEEMHDKIAALSSPRADVGEEVWGRFASWLLDHCEGMMVSEEMLQQQLAAMLATAPDESGKDGGAK